MGARNLRKPHQHGAGGKFVVQTLHQMHPHGRRLAQPCAAVYARWL